MRRLALLVALTFGLGVLAPVSTATAAPVETIKIKGFWVTAIGGVGAAGITIIDRKSAELTPQQAALKFSSPASTVSGLGRVSIHQVQQVTPTLGVVPSPALSAGIITSQPDTYLVAADGSKLYYSFTTTFRSSMPTGWPAGAPWPIAFPDPTGSAPAFAITFTHGTGRFLGAQGSAFGSGGYCFVANRGVVAVEGTITMPAAR